MKNFLLVLLLLAPLTQAADEDLSACEHLASLAKQVAVTRDNGHSLKAALGAVGKGDDETDVRVRNTVRAVYRSRLLSPEEVEEIYLASCDE